MTGDTAPPPTPRTIKLLLAEIEAESEQRREVEAKALGFSSWAEQNEQESAQSVERSRRAGRVRDEKARALGLTREEYEAQQEAIDPQRHVINLRKFENIHTICRRGCEDHAIPFFCAASLLPFSSQDLPDEMKDKSAISTVAHEARWKSSSPEQATMLPNWAYADPVLRQMVSSGSLSATPTAHCLTTFTTEADIKVAAPSLNWRERQHVERRPAVTASASDQCMEPSGPSITRTGPHQRKAAACLAKGGRTRVGKRCKAASNDPIALHTRSRKETIFYALDRHGAGLALGFD
ncbi:MAG: hypothetical protein M1826_003635 [Phylliscum demangeonii]|nr:MAG: hypothetical protein M1826_003635 [Phylliscum demangeonii]